MQRSLGSLLEPSPKWKVSLFYSSSCPLLKIRYSLFACVLYIILIRATIVGNLLRFLRAGYLNYYNFGICHLVFSFTNGIWNSYQINLQDFPIKKTSLIINISYFVKMILQMSWAFCYLKRKNYPHIELMWMILVVKPLLKPWSKPDWRVWPTNLPHQKISPFNHEISRSVPNCTD